MTIRLYQNIGVVGFNLIRWTGSKVVIMSLTARLKKLHIFTKTARPCFRCLATKEALRIFREYLADRGVYVPQPESRNPSRFVIRECPQCGEREIRDIAHLQDEDLILLHALYSEQVESHRLGRGFSPEKIEKFKSFMARDSERERARYGEHYDGATMVAAQYLASVGFNVFEPKVEDETI